MFGDYHNFMAEFVIACYVYSLGFDNCIKLAFKDVNRVDAIPNIGGW